MGITGTLLYIIASVQWPAIVKTQQLLKKSHQNWRRFPSSTRQIQADRLSESAPCGTGDDFRATTEARSPWRVP